MSARQRASGLEAAAEALVTAAHQLGADEKAAIDALERSWRRIGSAPRDPAEQTTNPKRA